MAGSGVRYTQPGSGLIYLRTLELAVQRSAEGLVVRVSDHDDGAAVAGATVGCEGCGEAQLTDDEGRATLRGLDPDSAVTLRVEHPEFNPQTTSVAPGGPS